MVSDAAIRQRRHRAHRRGQHDLCLPGALCTFDAPARPVPVPGDARPAVPAEFGVDGRRFWNSMVKVYELSPAELALLRRACSVLDRVGVLDEFLGSQRLDDPGTLPVLRHVSELEKTFAQLIAAMALPMPGEDEGKPRDLRQVLAAKAKHQKERARG